jgi:tetratricopeptide (TPR) repeat protein
VAGLIGTGAFALREGRARREADRRRLETERVAAFQESMLSGIDAQRMGQDLLRSLKQEARASLTARTPPLAPSEVDSRLEDLDAMLAGADATSVAVRSLDENILARAERAIHEKFADQPLVKASLLQTVASVLRDLGLDRRAEPAQREALAIRRTALGEDAPETIASLGNLGSLLKSQGRLDDSRPLLREAMERAKRVLGLENRETLMRMNNYADLLGRKEEWKEAEQLQREVLAARRRVLGNDDPDTLSSVGGLGVSLYGQRRFEEAEPYYREAMQSYRRTLGDEEPRTLVAISNMGYLLRARSRPEEALPLWSEALETRRRTLGKEHPDTLLSLITYAQALYAQKKLDAAEAGLEEALAIARRILTPVHPLLITPLESLDVVYRDQGKLPQAERMLREGLDAQRRVHPSDHPTVANDLANLGDLLMAEGGASRAAQAETFLRECLDMRTRLFPDGNPQAFLRRTASSLLGESILIQANALAGSRPEKALSRLLEARPLIVDAAEWMLTNPGMPAKGAGADRALEAAKRAVRLFEALDKAEPNAGHAEQVATWRKKVVERSGGVGAGAKGGT